MSIILLNLRDVPEDEAEEVRALLATHDIDFYETPPNHWGISMGAIWLKDQSQREEAKRLMAQYQRHRQARAREAYARLKEQGKTETVLDKIRREPLRVLVYLAVIGIVLYLSIQPFVSFGG